MVFYVVFVFCVLCSSTLIAQEVRLSCSSWGCKAFKESADKWADKHHHKVALYEAGRLSDNLLGLYRQVFSAQNNEFDILLIDTVWLGVLGKHLVDLKQYVPQQQINKNFHSIIANLTDKKGR